ncbi:MAG: FTR1 family protein [Cyanobacteria bacterium P01_F01_bin.150]
MDWSAALPTFVVTLREGVEATLLVSIVLAYLKTSGNDRLNSWVYGGIGMGLGLSLLVGILLQGILTALESSQLTYSEVIEEGLEASFGIIAIVLLSWMLIWMSKQARSLKAGVESELETLMQNSNGAGWGVFGLTLIAVLREGFETVIFISAKFQQGWPPVMGAFAGLIGAVAIGFLIFQLGIKINLRRFFTIMGLLLLLIVSGLVVSALRHVDGMAIALAHINTTWNAYCSQSSQACLLGPQVWDMSQVLPDRQFPGILLKAFFGYTQNLYLAQAVGYVFFLIAIGRLYLKSLSPSQ